MMDIKELTKEVVRRAKATGLRRRSLARAAGLSDNALRHLNDPKNFSPSIETVHAIQKALNHIEGLNEAEMRNFAKLNKIHPPPKTKKKKNIAAQETTT